MSKDGLLIWLQLNRAKFRNLESWRSPSMTNFGRCFPSFELDLELSSLAKNPKVSLTIDENDFPQKVLLIRGTARLELVEGIVPEYEACAARYFDANQSQQWLGQLRTMISSMVRISVTPEWVGLLDFKTRFPSALAG